MSLFESDEQSTPAAILLAKGFKSEANQELDRVLASAYDAIARFWFRNVDENGKPSAVRPAENEGEPTGPEILEALGTDAAYLLNPARERVKYAIAATSMFNKTGEIDQQKLYVPYDLVWNEDGSLKSATLKVVEEPETETEEE